METYQFKVRVAAIVGLNINADSPEQAMLIGRERVKSKSVLQIKGIEIIDSNETVLGADSNNWDLD